VQSHSFAALSVAMRENSFPVQEASRRLITAAATRMLCP
jgi:hypothetical protein